MKNRAITITVSGLAGLSLWTTMALAQVVDPGIPLVCRPPEAGETPNAYIPTSQNPANSARATGQGDQQVGRPSGKPSGNSTGSLSGGHAANPTLSPSVASPANLPASPMPSAQTTTARPQRQGQAELAPLEREVQTGTNYRICPPPTMPSETPSTQLYAVPYAVAAAWECYGPRAMAYTPRPWHGPDPAVHSPLPLTPQRSSRAPSSKAKVAPAKAAKPEDKASPVPAIPSAEVVMPVPAVGASAHGASATAAPNAAISGTNGDSAAPAGGVRNGATNARPSVMGGQASVAAPVMVPSAPQSGQNGQLGAGQAAQNPYSGAASSVSPSRDIVDAGESGARTAQAPVSLLNAPPLVPNPTPTPSGFNPR